MAAADFEAASCPRVRNEIKKTKLHSNTAPAADINTLLCAVPVLFHEHQSDDEVEIFYGRGWRVSEVVEVSVSASCPRAEKEVCRKQS